MRIGEKIFKKLLSTGRTIMQAHHGVHLSRLLRFFLYGFIGLTLEVIYTGLSALIHGDWRMPGYTFLVMIAIYGLAVFLEPVHNRIRPLPWWTRGLIYLFLIWGIEYYSGLFLKVLLGECPWNYTDPLNIQGLITLKMAPEWFFAGLGFEFLHDLFDRLEKEFII
jgi:uncharacterized membrane protein